MPFHLSTRIRHCVVLRPLSGSTLTLLLSTPVLEKHGLGVLVWATSSSRGGLLGVLWGTFSTTPPCGTSAGLARALSRSSSVSEDDEDELEFDDSDNMVLTASSDGEELYDNMA
mmetsp:Transcript_49145/g.129601  ORF Transcript_49145/g.129601 Transcript_49145/m.129601 type:complete len:114 (+) Transcript_49145:379-720(+)